MTWYFIDLHDGNGVIRDDEGADYDHLEDALDEAKASANDVVRELSRRHKNKRLSLSDTCVEIRDESGQTVAALTVAEVMAHPVHPHFKNECAPIPNRH